MIEANEPCFTILMATYNGAAFVEEQINSIISQTYPKWKLLISDDGSTDGTIDIITNISRRDSRIHIINKNMIPLGPALNFLSLLKFVDTDYCVLSDQDDIWHFHKLSILKAKLMSVNLDTPFLFYGNMTIVDSRGFDTGVSLYNSDKSALLNKNIDWVKCRSSAYGATFMFNRRLIDLAANYPAHVTMHDHWLLLLANVFGTVIYYPERLVSYRRHYSNVISSIATNPIQRVCQRYHRAFRVIRSSAYTTEMLTVHGLTPSSMRLLDAKTISLHFRIDPKFSIIYFTSLVIWMSWTKTAALMRLIFRKVFP